MSTFRFRDKWKIQMTLGLQNTRWGSKWLREKMFPSALGQGQSKRNRGEGRPSDLPES